MAFTILNQQDQAYPDVFSMPDARDFDMIALRKGADDGVVSGCAVSVQSPAAMDLDVASGTIRIGGSNVSVSSGSVTIGAAPVSGARIDLVVVTNAGALAVVAGTSGATPLIPAIPANRIPLAAVYVPSGATEINGGTTDDGEGKVLDKRLFVASSFGFISHSSLADLTSGDHHTQYALLAGRAGGQTLIGGTGSGENLVLTASSHGTPGAINMTGLVGLRIAGYVNVGVVGTPTNTDDGDLTATRLNIGDSGAFGASTGYFMRLTGTMTDSVSSSAAFHAEVPTFAPTSNGTTEYRTYFISGIVAPSTGVTMGTLKALYGEMENRSDAAITTIMGADLRPLVLRSGSPATVGTISTVIGVNAVPYVRASGTSVVTVSTMYGYRVESPTAAGATVTDYIGYFMSNPGASFTPTTAIGMYIVTQSRATGNNLGAHFSDNRVMIGGDVPGIADGSDGHTAITRTMAGLELAADHMNTTNMYTSALKFMSSDGEFTTENPKLLAYVVGRALETFNGDDDGGMAIEFGVTPNTPGTTNVPRNQYVMHPTGMIVSSGSLSAITPSALLHLKQQTIGNEVLRISSDATSDDPTRSFFQARGTTTDATQATLATITIPATTTVKIRASVVARRTGGAAGTAEDGAGYEIVATVKNVAGTATLIGAVSALVTQEDQAAWDATIDVTGATARIRVTGAADNNVTWHTTYEVESVGS